MNPDKVRARLAALATRDADGTPGPWRTGRMDRRCTMNHAHSRDVCDYQPVGWSDEAEYFGRYVSTAKGLEVVGGNDYGPMLSRDDARLVAEMRTALPALLAIAEATLALGLHLDERDAAANGVGGERRDLLAALTALEAEG